MTLLTTFLFHKQHIRMLNEREDSTRSLVCGFNTYPSSYSSIPLPSIKGDIKRFHSNITSNSLSTPHTFSTQEKSWASKPCKKCKQTHFTRTRTSKSSYLNLLTLGKTSAYLADARRVPEIGDYASINEVSKAIGTEFIDHIWVPTYLHSWCWPVVMLRKSPK